MVRDLLDRGLQAIAIQGDGEAAQDFGVGVQDKDCGLSLGFVWHVALHVPIVHGFDLYCNTQKSYFWMMHNS